MGIEPLLKVVGQIRTIAWKPNLPCMSCEHAQNWLNPCTPNIKAQIHNHNASADLCLQDRIDVARISVTKQACGHDPPHHLRSRWDIAAANDDV